MRLNVNTISGLDCPIATDTNEELASPRLMDAPVKRRERISSLDVIRGFAMMGILVLNIDDFAMPEIFHDVPVGDPIPAFVGPHTHVNLITLFIKWMFFEGKMRGIFELLFGAGVILLTSRAENRGNGAGVADIYLRRNMWLTFIGWVHGSFIWAGDIIFKYGLCGLLFLYPCRKLRPKTLFLMGLLLALTIGSYGYMKVFGGFDDMLLAHQVSTLTLNHKDGQPLTAEEMKIQNHWKAVVDSNAVTPASIADSMSVVHESYLEHVWNSGLQYGPKKAGSPWSFQFFGPLGVMLIGMGLLKNGFLTGELSYGVYFVTATMGFLISLPIYVIGILRSYASGFDFLTVDRWIFIPYGLTQLTGSIAITAVLLIIIKSGVFGRVLHPFAAVGQTALSNYLLTSLICQTLFLWGPWKLYGKLEYYQLNYVVLAVWVVNLTVSSLWLRVFEFGPVEWLWRSLTYGKPQPMLIVRRKANV
jgi:uncharacterized protein